MSDRPRTRADCKDGPRPCAFIGCRHHLAEPRRDSSGRLHLGVLGPHDGLALSATADEIEAWTERASDAVISMTETCALDVADREPDGNTLDALGQRFGVSRERIRQIENKAMNVARRAARRKLGRSTVKDL